MPRKTTIQSITRKALADQDFFMRLMEDPEGALRDAGWALPPAKLRELKKRLNYGLGTVRVSSREALALLRTDRVLARPWRGRLPRPWGASPLRRRPT